MPADLSTLPLADVLTAASDHRIAPAVSRRLRAGTAIPEWEEAFDAERHQQLFRHMRTHAELATIGTTLSDAGIEWLVAKGPVAADVIWPHPDMREYHDLDLFVNAADFERALGILLEDGCTLVDRNWPELARTMRAEIALVGRYGTPIDLHWHMAVPRDLRRTFRIDMAEMFSRTRTVTLGNGRKVATFDEVDTALHLAFHSAQAGASKLMWAGDIHYASLSPGFDADEFVGRAQVMRIDRPVSAVVNRVQSITGERGNPELHRVRASTGPWGRAVRALERRATFPNLPRDGRSGSIPIAGMRPTDIGSMAATARAAIEIRSLERRVNRHGPEDRTLHHDVPDAAARRDYFRMVGHSVRDRS
ncbi:nucleotidyltransferase family protein [Rathayibacter sp. CAU 1779]